jgi:hypothetical protein
MIRFIRSVRVQPGKQREAAQWAQEVAQQVSRLSGTDAQVFTEVFGEAGTLYWVTQHQDFATLLQVMEQMPQDQQLQDAVARGADLLVGGTLRDRVLRSL